MREPLDVAVVGGGILGLLTLRELRRRGVRAYLFEQGDLGGDQTLHSQAFLIRGHLYTRVDPPPPFADALSRWQELLTEVGVVAEGRTLHALASLKAGVFPGYWESRGLTFHRVSQLPNGLDGSGVEVFDSGEQYILDASTFLRKVVEGECLEPFIVRAEVVSADPASGEIVVAQNGVRASFRAGVLAIASGRKDVCGLTARSAFADAGERLGALVLRGPEIPDYALVVDVETVQGRKGIRWMCVPRVAPTGERAWLCSALLPKGVGPWQERTASELAKRCSLDLVSLKVDGFEESFWPGFDPDTGFQVRVDQRAVAAWPVRLTLAPLAAERLAFEAQKILNENRLEAQNAPASTPMRVASEWWMR